MNDNNELQEEMAQRLALYFRLIESQSFEHAAGALAIASQLAQVEQAAQLRRIANTLAQIEVAWLLREPTP